MFFNDIKINKVSATQSITNHRGTGNRLLYTRSLLNKKYDLQTVKSLEGEVVELLEEGDVIFTTPTGERFKFKTMVDLNLNDKIKLEFTSEEEPRIVQITSSPTHIIKDEVEFSEQVINNNKIALSSQISSNRISQLKLGDILHIKVAYISQEILEAGIVDTGQIEQLKKLSVGEIIRIQIHEMDEGMAGENTKGEVSFTPVTLLQEMVSSLSEEQAVFFKGRFKNDYSSLRQTIDTDFAIFEVDEDISLQSGGLKFTILSPGDNQNSVDHEKIGNIKTYLELISHSSRLKALLSSVFLNPSLIPILKNILILARNEVKFKKDQELLIDTDIQQSIEEWKELEEGLKALHPFFSSNYYPTWQEIRIPFKEEADYKNAQGFVKRIENGDIHFISNLNLSHLGQIQLEVFFKINNLSALPSIAQEISLYINYIQEFPESLKNEIREIFLNTINSMNVKGYLHFQQLTEFSSLNFDKMPELEMSSDREIII